MSKPRLPPKRRQIPLNSGSASANINCFQLRILQRKTNSCAVSVFAPTSPPALCLPLSSPPHGPPQPVASHSTVAIAGTVGNINNIPVANGTTSDSDGNGYAVETSSTAAFTLGTGGTLAASGDVGLDAAGSGPGTVNAGSTATGWKP